MPHMKVFQHSAGGVAFAFRAVCAIFLSKNLESSAGDAAALIAPGRKLMQVMVEHRLLRGTFELDPHFEAGPVA